MLTFEEAVETVRVQEGQLLVPLSDLFLDTDRLITIFKSTALTYSKKNPVRVTENMMLNVNGVTLPSDVYGVSAVRPLMYNNFSRLSTPMQRNYWEYDINSRRLKTLYTFNFAVTMLKGLTTGNLQIIEEPVFVYAGETTVSHKLRGDFKKGSIEISKGDLIMSPTSTTGNLTTLSGTLGSGTYDSSTLTLNLTLLDSSQGEIEIKYISKNPAIMEIDLSDQPFMMILAARIITSFGAIKSQVVIDGIPFNIQNDELLRRAEFLTQQAEAMFVANNKWYQWGY